MPIAPTTMSKWRGDWVNGGTYNNYDVVRSLLNGGAYVLDNGNVLSPSVVDPSLGAPWVPVGAISPPVSQMASIQVISTAVQTFTNANQVVLYWDTVTAAATGGIQETNAAGLSPPGTNNGFIIPATGRYQFTVTINTINTAGLVPDDLTIFPLVLGSPIVGTAATLGYNGVNESATPLTAVFLLDLQASILVSFAARAQLTNNLIAVPMGDPPQTPTGGSVVISCVRIS